MDNQRYARQGTLFQGPTESIKYDFDTTAIGESPTSVTVDVFSSVDDYSASVKSTTMPSGDPVVVGNVITLPALEGLVKFDTYEIRISFTISANEFERIIRVHCV